MFPIYMHLTLVYIIIIKGTQEENEMAKLYIQAITRMGCVVYTEISLPEDYTMNQVVKEVKRLDYQAFRIVETMKRFVYI